MFENTVSFDDFVSGYDKCPDCLSIRIYIRPGENKNSNGICYSFNKILSPSSHIPEKFIEGIKPISSHYCLQDGKRIVYAEVFLKKTHKKEEDIFYDLLAGLISVMSYEDASNLKHGQIPI